MNDTLIFFVLAALALIFKWLTSKAEKSQAEKEERESESAPPNEQAPPPLRPAPQSEEERVRRFLEALGMPAGTQPPPPVRQRRVVTPAVPQTPPAQKPKVKRSYAQPLPPLVTTPEDLRPPPLQSAPPPLPTAASVAPAPPEIEVPLPPLPAFVPATPPGCSATARPRDVVRRDAPLARQRAPGHCPARSAWPAARAAAHQRVTAARF